MINLETELTRYRALVMGVDPRVGAALDRVTAAFDATLGTTAGTCGGAEILLNPASTDEQQRETLGHELAHALDHAIFRGRAHGYGWAFWMRKLGLKPERYHRYEELLMKHPGAVYKVTCLDCGGPHLSTFVRNYCVDETCGSPDVRIDRKGII